MHVPDGFINAPVSAATGVVAAAAVAVSLRGARRELAGAGAGGIAGAERTAPLAGLVAAFIFAVQMLNFPLPRAPAGICWAVRWRRFSSARTPVCCVSPSCC